MTTPNDSKPPLPALARSDGHALLSAHEAIIKGVLEAETPVTLIAGPRADAFANVFRAALVGSTAIALHEHATRVVPAPDASRAVMLAVQTALSGKASVVLIPNDALDDTLHELSRVAGDALSPGGGMCVVMEDDPRANPTSCPRRAVARLGMPAIEALSVANLRDSIDHALLLSRAGRCPVALIVHASILRSADTVELRANRVGRVVEVLHVRRRRRTRLGWSGDAVAGGGLLRTARRLELNRFRSVPSPGERVPIGFVTIGPADAALMHLVDLFGLHGRVPVLQLQVINPLDDAAIGRMLLRCQNVMVLEPRPGTVEVEVLALAEQMRHRSEAPAAVWGRRVPPPVDETAERVERVESSCLASDDDVHPSILARRITHLLHAIRPSVQIAAQLAAEPPPVPPLPPRESEIGAAAAIAALRRMLRDVDQWLRERAPLEERGIAPTTLAIDGAEPAGPATRSVYVETWDHRRFQRYGVQAIVQASRDERPWMLLVIESADEGASDLERLARGAIPAERASGVALETANFSDATALRDLLRESALHDRLTVVIVRDGPPPQYDVAAVDASFGETDRLGFEPRQRLIETAEGICAVRPVASEESEHRQPTRVGSGLKTETSVERVSERVPARFRLRIRPMLEEVEVTRVRPPEARWRQARTVDGALGAAESGGAARLPTPQPVHAQQPRWRAHLAGVRGEAPGAAAIVLSEAGRFMGYHVRSVHDPTPIGARRRAWTQMLFTRPRSEETAPEIATAIPYGEADLLLGLDGREALRAIGPDLTLQVASATATCAIVNIGPLSDDRDFAAPDPPASAMVNAIGAVSRVDRRQMRDFAAACRAWFHTDRVTDMALLGAAYQLGFVPLSAEAIEAGLLAVEGRGFGRSRDAFDLGRRLALDDDLFQQREENDAGVPIERIARRLALSMRKGTPPWIPGSRDRASRLVALLHNSLEQMPGLAETDLGRQARRDFVMACHHCVVWGGVDYAETYADLITRLYQVDRGDTGRALTRAAVLPLAEAMLIRDPLYVAGMAASAEHRRRVRQRLHAKRARGDEIERRYLTRINLLAFSRRARIDLRTSDWPARLASAVRRITPQRFRGAQRERQLREYVMTFVRRAIVESPQDYPRWAEAMQRLHDQAAEDRLRGMAMAEVRMLVEMAAAAP